MSQLNPDTALAPTLRRERSVRVWSHLLIGLALFAITVLVYRHILTGIFLNWDDPALVVGNERFTPPAWDGLREFWTEYRTGYLGLYTPMAYSVWWMIAYAFGLGSATPFHTANVVLHACNVVLVFMLLQRLLSGRFADDVVLMASALGACLFGLHPMQVEAVCWVSGFNNVIAATFSLYALVRLCDALQADTRRRALAWYAFATTGLLLAFLSKPTALVTPLVAAVLCLMVLRVPVRRTARWLAPWFLLMLPFVYIGWHVQDASFMKVSLPHRLLVSVDTVAFYTAKVLVPCHISADYGRTPEIVVARWISQPLWPLAGLLVAACLYFWRRFRWLAAASAIGIAAIAPTIGIIPFFFQSYSTVADRYFYLAMLGPTLLLAATVCVWPRWRTVIIWMLVLVILGTMSFHQAIRWRATYFWSADILRANPDSVVGDLAMGNLLAHDGYLEQARPYLMHARETNPWHPRVLLALGMYYMDAHQPAEALTCLMYLLRENPYFHDGYQMVATAAVRNGTPQLGIMSLSEVVAKRPDDARAHASLGSLYGYMGQYEQCYAHLRRSLELKPGNKFATDLMAQLWSELHQRNNAPRAGVPTTTPARQH